jgi:peptidoglycan/LPS O-acetylase OafA/YrhL
MEPEERQQPSRYYEIDLLRFVAAMAVVLYHLAYPGLPRRPPQPRRLPRAGLGVQVWLPRRRAIFSD